MATPLSADRLVAALRAEGCTVVEVPGWRTNNRNHVGAWGPVNGVMIHHTVTTGTNGTVNLCFEGRSDLPGPLCHGVIAKDGVIHLVGNGRANHAGKGDGDVLAAVIAERALPAPNEQDTDGNTRFYGFECVNLGDNNDPWPVQQVDAIVRASAALCRAHGWGRDGDTSTIGHKEWTNQKIDPRGPLVEGGTLTMSLIRGRVAERLQHPANWDPEDDVALTTDDINKIAAATVTKLLAGGGALEVDDLRRIWTTDGILPAPVDNTDNPYWAPHSYLRDTNRRLRDVQAKLAAQEAAITELARALAAHDEQVDADALIARITQAIESIDIRLEAA